MRDFVAILKSEIRFTSLSQGFEAAIFHMFETALFHIFEATLFHVFEAARFHLFEAIFWSLIKWDKAASKLSWWLDCSRRRGALAFLPLRSSAVLLGQSRADLDLFGWNCWFKPTWFWCEGPPRSPKPAARGSSPWPWEREGRGGLREPLIDRTPLFSSRRSKRADWISSCLFFKTGSWNILICKNKWSKGYNSQSDHPVFFKTIRNILGCRLLTKKIDIIKLFGVLGGRMDGFKLDQTSDYDV